MDLFQDRHTNVLQAPGRAPVQLLLLRIKPEYFPYTACAFFSCIAGKVTSLDDTCWLINYFFLQYRGIKSLDQVETKEYEHPYKIHKVPVQNLFFYHFIPPLFIRSGKLCFIYMITLITTPLNTWKPLETCDAKEITTESDRPWCVAWRPD